MSPVSNLSPGWVTCRSGRGGDTQKVKARSKAWLRSDAFDGPHRLRPKNFQAKSEVNLAPEDLDTAMLLHEVSRKLHSRSLEHLSGLAIWNCVPIVVTLEKDSRGLGFSIVDYKVKIEVMLSRERYNYLFFNPNMQNLFDTS